MEEMIPFDSPIFVEAVILWTGWGKMAFPIRDESTLMKHFGEELTMKLLPEIKSLEDDFYQSDARFVASDLQEMSTIATNQFKAKYPSIPDLIVKIFAWCYTFDYK